MYSIHQVKIQHLRQLQFPPLCSCCLSFSLASHIFSTNINLLQKRKIKYHLCFVQLLCPW
ncbi:rCG58307 [Rattus norvegicus]|uniref:RCG58307 n=1 Tax=Rattus norvegicus TaxID=10116 RepID=A6J3N1_RAT|nr:rCG58307 [Rattus norvegicus]